MQLSTDLVSYRENFSDADAKRIEKLGHKLYQDNQFLQDLTNLMEHPLFKSVGRDYFNSWDNIQLFISFFKIYEKIGDQFPEFNGYQKIYLVKSMIDNSHTRGLICSEIVKSSAEFIHRKDICRPICRSNNAFSENIPSEGRIT